MAIPKAKQIYDDIAYRVVADGKQVSPLGISVKRFLEYFDITEDDIRNYVQDEVLILQLCNSNL